MGKIVKYFFFLCGSSILKFCTFFFFVEPKSILTTNSYGDRVKKKLSLLYTICTQRFCSYMKLIYIFIRLNNENAYFWNWFDKLGYIISFLCVRNKGVGVVVLLYIFFYFILFLCVTPHWQCIFSFNVFRRNIIPVEFGSKCTYHFHYISFCHTGKINISDFFFYFLPSPNLQVISTRVKWNNVRHVFFFRGFLLPYCLL